MDLRITSKTIWFQVKNDADRQAIDTIIQTEQNPLSCCENLICVGDDVLLYNRRKKMALRHGMNTLQQTLQLTDVPIRIKPDSSMPGYFFENYLALGTIENDSVVKLQGDITRGELQAFVVEAKARSQNNTTVKHVLKKGTIQCVIDGNVPMNQLQTIKTAEQALKNVDIEQRCLQNDLEFGYTVSYTVRQTGKRVVIKSFKDPSLAIITEERDPNEEMAMETSCDDMMNMDDSEKKKHYYIYSNNPGYGKTKFSARLQRKWNACSVKDSNNFSGFRDNVQFIIFDEFSHDTKILFPDLKKLTGGNASDFGGNKKVFGDAFVPRADAQVIIFSNNHLFECIGKYNQKLKRRTVSLYMARQMMERFHIIKLDDETRSETVDALKYIDVNESFEFPFDIRFNKNGRPIDDKDNFMPYSLVCKFDTRYNTAFNTMKQTILFSGSDDTKCFEPFDIDDDNKTQIISNNKRRFRAMCVEDTLKRYLDLNGCLDEYTVRDCYYDKLDYLINHEKELAANDEFFYFKYIFDNRHELYESISDSNMTDVCFKRRVLKWYDKEIYDETMVDLKQRQYFDNGFMDIYFKFVMEQIRNPNQKPVKQKVEELKQIILKSRSKFESRKSEENVEETI